ncbi:MAG: hypothetical protein OCU22_09305 [Canidatus Methanoxibalbensis ujae]|nr:hypothetical protein [Candidatus Methanoxibalbensis ujae]
MDGWTVIWSGIVTFVAGYLLYMFNSYNENIKNIESRLTALEVDIKYIKEAIKEIKRKMKEEE